MRLLNSVCRVIASDYSGVPVHIEEVPNNFERNSFYVTLATGSSELKISMCMRMIRYSRLFTLRKETRLIKW